VSKVKSFEFIALHTWELVIRTNNANNENMTNLIGCFFTVFKRS